MKKQLKFSNDGKFRIMCFGDLHEANEFDTPTEKAKFEDMQLLMKTAIERLKPDLAVFMGDAPAVTGVEGPEQYCFYTMRIKYTVTIYYPEGNETWTQEKRYELAGESPRWMPMHAPDAEHTPGDMDFDGSSHWGTCTGCPERFDVTAHSYSADCDQTCNVCNALRKVSHSYGEEWQISEERHWHECACGAKTEDRTHAYGNAEAEGDQLVYTCVTCGHTKSVPAVTQPTQSQPAQTQPGGEADGDKNDMTVVIVAVAAVAVIGGGIVLVLKKKKA